MVLFLNDFYLSLFFFFQAEDGIRDRDVTGVQTCALPIWRLPAVLVTAVRGGEPVVGHLPEAGQAARRSRSHRAGPRPAETNSAEPGWLRRSSRQGGGQLGQH